MGRCGQKVVAELSRFLRAFVSAQSMESIALKAVSCCIFSCFNVHVQVQRMNLTVRFLRNINSSGVEGIDG